MAKLATDLALRAEPRAALRRTRPRRLPEWITQADRALAEAASRVRVIAASTPLNFRAELGRLTECWERGERQPPRFVYADPTDHATLVTALQRLAEVLE